MTSWPRSASPVASASTAVSIPPICGNPYADTSRTRTVSRLRSADRDDQAGGDEADGAFRVRVVDLDLDFLVRVGEIDALRLGSVEVDDAAAGRRGEHAVGLLGLFPQRSG